MTATQRRCLFCLGSDGGFTSREHIVSEALGNTELVLPPGIVCDRCNNGPLSRADDALIGLPPITLLRAERGLPTKGGKAVVSRWGNAKVGFEAPGHLVIETTSKQAMKGMPPPGKMPPGGGKLELTTGGPMTAARLGQVMRSMWKTALELVYWDFGPELAYDHLFDDARVAIVGSGAAHGWAVVTKNSVPGPSVQVQYQFRVIAGRWAMPIRYDVFGVEFHTDLLRRDLTEGEIKPPFESNVWVV